LGRTPQPERSDVTRNETVEERLERKRIEDLARDLIRIASRADELAARLGNDAMTLRATATDALAELAADGGPFAADGEGAALDELATRTDLVDEVAAAVRLREALVETRTKRDAAIAEYRKREERR
jgi:hypothetical protein